jgi:heterodisulfide reductase subunit C
MEKFGFTLNPSSRIDLDKTDRDKFAALAKAEPDVLKCMACGSCTASCTAGKFTRTSVRSAILALQNGQEKEEGTAGISVAAFLSAENWKAAGKV